MVTRASYTSASAAFTGGQYADDMAEKTDLWFNNMTLIPTLITNTGNDYTITVDPVLKTGTDVVAGMGFHVIPSADNTGIVRLRVTEAGTYFNVVKSNGANLAANDFKQDTVYHLLFIGGAYRILNATDISGGSSISGLVNEQIFNTSGTWTKPTEISTTAMVEVYLWGGGGGGSGGGGGGGGACVTKTYKITELPSTVAVTIGAGGAAGAQGGVSTFGSLLSAFGGGGGGANAWESGGGSGGGGGGLTSAGQNAQGIAGFSATRGGDGGRGGGGGGNVFSTGGYTNPETSTTTNYQTTVVAAGYSGGAGGCSKTPLSNGSQAEVLPLTAAGSAIQGGGGGATNRCDAGASVLGGGGGGCSGRSGGASVYGGAGGNNGAIGNTPAGGGGSGAAGGIGKCQVRIFL